jgi:hypothetical protein
MGSGFRRLYSLTPQFVQVFLKVKEQIMLRTTRLLMTVAIAMAVSAIQIAEASIQVPWNGPSDGDNMTITFSPFTANTLTSISGGGYSHNHGVLGTVFGIDLRVNGSWVNIHSWSHDGIDHLLSEQTSGGSIDFSLGLIDALRLTDVPLIGNAYHGMYGSYLSSGTTTFTFDTEAVAAVPEPVSIAVWSIIAITTCVAVWWKRPQPCST